MNGALLAQVPFGLTKKGQKWIWRELVAKQGPLIWFLFGGRKPWGSERSRLKSWAEYNKSRELPRQLEHVAW